MITNKKHIRIINHLEEVYKSNLQSVQDKIAWRDKKIKELEQELKEARDLKDILNKFSNITFNGISISTSGGDWKLELPDTVLQYIDDILGGKVIKQEGNKCIVIDKEGNVKTGLTKQKIDKGYSYKLIRQ